MATKWRCMPPTLHTSKLPHTPNKTSRQHTPVLHFVGTVHAGAGGAAIAAVGKAVAIQLQALALLAVALLGAAGNEEQGDTQGCETASAEACRTVQAKHHCSGPLTRSLGNAQQRPTKKCCWAATKAAQQQQQQRAPAKHDLRCHARSDHSAVILWRQWQQGQRGAAAAAGAAQATAGVPCDRRACSLSRSTCSGSGASGGGPRWSAAAAGGCTHASKSV